MPTIRLILAAVLATLLAACGGGGAAPPPPPPPAEATAEEATEEPTTEEPTEEPATEEPTTEEPTEEPTTEEPTETADGMTIPSEVVLPTSAPTLPPSESMSDEEFVAALEAYLTPFFITAEELGPTWVQATWQLTEGAGPCGIDVDSGIPPFATFGTLLTPTDAEITLEEEFRAYDTVDAAASAFTLARDSVGCGASTVDPGQATLTEVVDVSAEIGTDAFAVGVMGEGFEGVLVVALVSDTLVSFEFLGATGAAEAFGAADPGEVAAYGVDKLITGFESS